MTFVPLPKVRKGTGVSAFVGAGVGARVGADVTTTERVGDGVAVTVGVGRGVAVAVSSGAVGVAGTTVADAGIDGCAATGAPGTVQAEQISIAITSQRIHSHKVELPWQLRHRLTYGQANRTSEGCSPWR